MKLKKTFSVFIASFLTLTSFAQVTVNENGDCCIGSDSCFYDFRGAFARLGGPVIGWPAPIWTNVMSTTLNVGGGISIAASPDDWQPAFSVSAPYKIQLGMSISPFFSIDYDGTVYSREGIVQSSDSTLKTNITVLTSTLSKLKTLKGVSYNFKNDESAEAGQLSRMNRSNVENQSPSRKHIGLLAQDVEKVYPEVVYTLNDSTKGIAYADLVAVLIEGIKELDDSLSVVSDRYTLLQEQIKDLQMQMENMRAAYSPGKGKSEKNNSGNASKMVEAALYQNVPNPFSGKTEISYRITPDAQNTYIKIYDLTGKQQKQYALNANSLTGKVEIAASDFEPGMYIYSLVIDGKVIDSKRMLIEK